MIPGFLHVVSHHGLEHVASDAQDLLVNHEALLETVTYVHNSMFEEEFKLSLGVSTSRPIEIKIENVLSVETSF